MFNEVTTLALSYMLFLFSEANLLLDCCNHFEYDLLFIGTMGLNVAVHMVILLTDSLRNIIHKLKTKCCKKKAAKPNSMIKLEGP